MPPPMAESDVELIDAWSVSATEREVLRAFAASVDRGESGGLALADERRFDATLGFERGWHLPAIGPMTMRSFCVAIPDALAGRRVRGFRARWSEPTAVRSVSLAPDPRRVSRVMETDLETPGYEGMGDVGDAPSGALGACGADGAFELPIGYAIELPANGDVIVEMQAQPVGRAATIVGAIDWRMAEPDCAVVDARVFALPPLEFPAQTSTTLRASFPLVGGTLVGVMPRAGPLARAIEVSIAYADGRAPTRVASIADWNPEFRRPVLFASPLSLPDGASLEVVVVVDNTSGNPRNPWTPPRAIGSGVPPTGESVGIMVWTVVEPRS